MHKPMALRAIGRMAQDTTGSGRKRVKAAIGRAEQRVGEFMRKEYDGPARGSVRAADSLSYRGNQLEAEENASYERDMRGEESDNGVGRRLRKEAEDSYRRSGRTRALAVFRRKIT